MGAGAGRRAMRSSRSRCNGSGRDQVRARERHCRNCYFRDFCRSSLWLVHACMASEVCVWLAGEEEAMPLGSSAGFDVVSEMFSRNMFATPAAADEYQ